ncbi:MAG: RICIN domain-containing protein, partial [Oscillospiraceae bacterium]|nr:RICIN domain-containing protein [Oscillospiraceae bacterium]
DSEQITNGTSAELWPDAGTDSQLFKFVPNEDGSYTITTKMTKDLSALGVAMGSKDEGAAVVQWECNGSDDQKWNVEEKTEEEIVIGDVNEDGKLSVSDVIMLQKWLVCVPDATLTNWQNADLSADVRVNAFDLCIIKRELLAQ